MSNIETFTQTTFNRFRSSIFYDGQYYIIIDEQEREIQMIESEVIVYLVQELTGEYFFEHLMLTFLHEYLLKLLRRNVYRNHQSPSSGA